MKPLVQEQGLPELVDGKFGPLNAQLERQLNERTLELHAMRMEMDNFTHSIAHDLRGPLMHIGGFAELLLDHSGAQLDDKGKQYLRTIITSTGKLERMFNEFVAFSRLSRVKLQPAPVELGVLVRGVIHELEITTGDRRVIWKIEDLCPVRADPTLLRQVLVNLVANALKFTQPRAITRIQIGLQQGVRETVFFVRDNGVGFDMEHCEKLFGVFQRLHIASAFAGNGLGLASVRRIIERHGGRTWAEGIPGEGAIFYFSLPEISDGQAVIPNL